MKKIITVIGARPQFIKAAAVSRGFHKTGLKEIIIHTGQHFDENMSDIFFQEMDIPKPDYHLDINSLSHGAMTGRMIEKIEEVLLSVKPDMVLVYGDTNSTLAGALSARKLNIPVTHVEAGLRSFNMNMPEEINRILTDRISDYLFCPTRHAVNNLHREGFNHFKCQIHQVGDVMYDAAMYYGARSAERSRILQDLNLTPDQYILCTIHRQENTDDPDHLRSIISALNTINLKIPVVLPLHPRTRKILLQHHIEMAFKPIEPVGYFDIVQLLKNCKLVITDSGGMQKEAYFFKKYCLTVRNETEWTELVENGYNSLTGWDDQLILGKFAEYIDKPFGKQLPLYGNGDSALKIASILQSAL